MAKIITGIVIGIVAIFLLSIAITMTDDSIKQNRNSEELNCVGYVDSSDATLSYNSSLETNRSACAINAAIIPFLSLGVVIGLFFLIVYGTGATPLEPELPRI